MTRRRVNNPLALAVLACLVERPMHPYEMSTTLRTRGKERSIKLNYGSLYSVVDSLQRHGLIETQGTVREGRRPERTVYAITDAGRAATREWLEEMLAVPRQEFPEFPAALSHVMMLTPQEALGLLTRRETLLTAMHQGLEAGLASTAAMPRVISLESEYVLATATAQLTWLRSVIDDLRTGRLSWSEAELKALLDDRG